MTRESCSHWPRLVRKQAVGWRDVPLPLPDGRVQKGGGLGNECWLLLKAPLPSTCCYSSRKRKGSVDPFLPQRLARVFQSPNVWKRKTSAKVPVPLSALSYHLLSVKTTKTKKDAYGWSVFSVSHFSLAHWFGVSRLKRSREHCSSVFQCFDFFLTSSGPMFVSIPLLRWVVDVAYFSPDPGCGITRGLSHMIQGHPLFWRVCFWARFVSLIRDLL